MNEYRFAELENVKTPDEWVEKAVSIPDTVQKPSPLLLRSALIGTAAAVVILATVLITLSLHTGNINQPLGNNPVVVQTMTEAASAPEETQAASSPSATSEPAKESSVTGSSRTDISSDGSGAAGNYNGSVSSFNLSNNHTEAPTEKPVESSEAPTQPAATQPEPTQSAPTQPAEEQPTTEEANWFSGSLCFNLSEYNAMYYSDEIYVHLTQNGASFSEKYSDAELAIVSEPEEGKKRAVIVPKNNNILLMGNQYYQIEVYDNVGSSETFSAYLTN